jgi:MFS transporter, DHA2 family, multidrug resistance protein
MLVARNDAHRRAITGSVMLAVILQSIDVTIANVALPQMQGSLSATQDQIHWVLTSYVVASAIMMPITGFLATRFGRKRVFLTVVVGFVLSSVFVGIATSLPEIVFYRFIQGLFAAPLVPLTQSTMFDMNPGGRRGPAMAIFGMGIMVGPILGPSLGGVLTEYYSWRFVFYINVPIGMIAFLGIWTFLPETKIEHDRRFDWFGFGALSFAIAALQFILDRGQDLDWFQSSQIIAATVLGCLALYLFVVHLMTTTERSFIDKHIFNDRNFVVGLFLVAVVGLNLLTSLALITPYMQNLMGYPVMTAGEVLATRGVGTMAAMFIVGRLIDRHDPRLLVLFGFSMSMLFMYESSTFTPQVSEATLIRNGLLQGFGLGFMFVPLNTMTFATLAPEVRTQGTSLYGLMRNLGQSVGVAVAVFLFGRSVQANHAAISEYITPFNDGLRYFANGHWNLSTSAGRAALNNEVVRQAEVIAYSNDFTILMYFLMAVAPLIFLLRRPAQPQPIPEPENATAGA